MTKKQSTKVIILFALLLWSMRATGYGQESLGHQRDFLFKTTFVKKLRALMAVFSNDGRHSVHVGDPGVEILSTAIGDTYSTFVVSMDSGKTAEAIFVLPLSIGPST